MTLAEDLSLPPLLRGASAPAGATALATAVARAREGADPGLVVYAAREDLLQAALVLTPEVVLADAMAMVMAAANAMADALGALGPPEMAVQFTWPAGLVVNGASCGGLRAAAATRDPAAVPDWLVIGIEVPILPRTDLAPGTVPDSTVLWEEGAGDIAAPRLLESWARHMLVAIDRWEQEGMARIHADWTARALGIGEDIAFGMHGTAHSGRFTGIDAQGGMLLRGQGGMRAIPLTDMLDPA